MFLEAYGFKVGIINGDSGAKNQDTIAGFKAAPPQHRVIVSTEAGAEGVNLQVANVLVNFDLPWNPMIVEQRIGRIMTLVVRPVMKSTQFWKPHYLKLSMVKNVE